MMDVIRKQLSELKPNEKNVRRHNQNQVKELAKSIESFGVIRPIVCDENGVIMCGHGLYEALMFKGEDSADCIVMAGLTEKQKKKLMLADNKVYELGSNDYDLIDSILKEFGEEGDFAVPGYAAETLEDLYGIKSVEGDAEELQKSPIPQPEIPAGGGIPEEQEVHHAPQSVKDAREQAMARRIIVCPHCGETIEL